VPVSMSTAWIAKPVPTATAASRLSPLRGPGALGSGEAARGEGLVSSVADTGLTLRGDAITTSTPEA
jgi:hypothetical protein